MNWNWQDVAIFAVLMAYISFERWVSKAYPKPMLEITLGDRMYKATTVSDLERLIELWKKP